MEDVMDELTLTVTDLGERSERMGNAIESVWQYRLYDMALRRNDITEHFQYKMGNALDRLPTKEELLETLIKEYLFDKYDEYGDVYDDRQTIIRVRKSIRRQTKKLRRLFTEDEWNELTRGL